MRTAVLILGALLLSGCAGSVDDGVAGVARDWAEAVESEDWATACALLAPRTRKELEDTAKKPCDQALAEEATPPGGSDPEVDAYGHAAQASWAEDTVFLGDYAGSWLVFAASCTPTGENTPYDCQVTGG